MDEIFTVGNMDSYDFIIKYFNLDPDEDTKLSEFLSNNLCIIDQDKNHLKIKDVFYNCGDGLTIQIEIESKDQPEENFMLFTWTQHECLYCKEISNLRDFHHSYRMQVNNMESGEISPEVYFLECPKCKKKMICDNLNLKKINPEKKIIERKDLLLLYHEFFLDVKLLAKRPSKAVVSKWKIIKEKVKTMDKELICDNLNLKEISNKKHNSKRKNYHVSRNCRNCLNCSVMESGKHLISYQCDLDKEFTGLNYACEGHEFNPKRLGPIEIFELTELGILNKEERS